MAEPTSAPDSAQSAAKKTTTTKSAVKKSSARTSPAKKTAAQKSAAKTSAKKTTAKRTTVKKATAKKATAKKATAKKATAKKATAKKSATTATRKSAATTGIGKTVATTVMETTSSAAATGKAVVAKAAAATRKPVEAGKALVGRAGDRVGTLGQAVLAPSSAFITAAQGRAKEMALDPAALRTLADQALHSGSGRSGPVGEVADEFRTLGRLVSAYARGDYRDIPLDSLVMVIAGLVYVVSPIDLIPDALPVAGIADDAVAVGFVIRQVHHELTAFREWEAKGSS